MGMKFLSSDNEKSYVLLGLWKLHAHFLTAKITQLSWVENAGRARKKKRRRKKLKKSSHKLGNKMNFHRIYYLAVLQFLILHLIPSTHHLTNSSYLSTTQPTQPHPSVYKNWEEKKFSAKLLLLAKQVWKIKLAFLSLSFFLLIQHSKCLYELFFLFLHSLLLLPLLNA